MDQNMLKKKKKKKIDGLLQLTYDIEVIGYCQKNMEFVRIFF